MKKKNMLYVSATIIVSLIFLLLFIPQFGTLAPANQAFIDLSQNKANSVSVIIATFGVVVIMFGEKFKKEKPLFISFTGALMMRVFGAIILSVIMAYCFGEGVPLYMSLIFWLLFGWFIFYGFGYVFEEVDTGEEIFLTLLSFVFTVGLG